MSGRAQIPVNIDFHILETAKKFPNLLGPLMINDYIQGLGGDRVSDEELLDQFASELGDQELCAKNRQRILATMGAGGEYEKWANDWYLSGMHIQALFDGLFRHTKTVQQLLTDQRVPQATCWPEGEEVQILHRFMAIACKTTGGQFAAIQSEALEYYESQHYPGALCATYFDVIRKHMNFCESEFQFANQHGNYLLQFFGEGSKLGQKLRNCFRASERALGDSLNYVDTIDSQAGFCFSWVVALRPVCDLAQAPVSYIQPTLDGLEGIALLAPSEPVVNLHSNLWSDEEYAPLMHHLRYDLFLVYVLNGGRLNTRSSFSVDYTEEGIEGNRPFRPSFLLQEGNSKEWFWVLDQQAERMVPQEFKVGVEAISEATLQLMHKRAPLTQREHAMSFGAAEQITLKSTRGNPRESRLAFGRDEIIPVTHTKTSTFPNIPAWVVAAIVSVAILVTQI